MVSKAYLRNEVQRNINLFRQTNMDVYIIEATVAYAVYRGTGGTKLIPLPPFTDKIYTVVFHIAKVQSKTRSSISALELKRAEQYLVNKIDNFKHMEMVYRDGIKYSKLYTCQGTYLLQFNGPADLLAQIAQIILTETGEYRVVYPPIQDIVYKYLKDLGRN